MKRYYKLLLILAFLGLGVGIYAVTGWRGQAPDVSVSNDVTAKESLRVAGSDTAAASVEKPAAETPDADPGLAEREVLWQELARLEAQMDELGAAQSSMQYSVDDMLSNDTTGDVKSDSSQKQAEDFQRKIEQQQIVIATRLQQEEVDQEWALETERALNDTLASDELRGIELVSSRCGSTICQVELSFEQNLSPEETMQKLASHRSWNGPSFVELEQSGLIHIYFAREGHELPDVSTEAGYD